MPDSPTSDEAFRRRKLNSLLSQFDARQRAGQKINQDEMLRAFPELASELKAYFEIAEKKTDNALATTQLDQDVLRPDHQETLNPGVQEVDTASEFTVQMFGRYPLLVAVAGNGQAVFWLTMATSMSTHWRTPSLGLTQKKVLRFESTSLTTK